MAAGILLSGVAHAGLVGLVLGLPWLVPPAGNPVPVLEVSLVTPAELSAAVAAARTRAPAAAAPAEEPAPVPKAETTPPAAAPAAEPPPDEEEAEQGLSLAPAFDPERTLAPGPDLAMASPDAAVRAARLPPGPLLTSGPPRPRPGGGGAPVVARGLTAPAGDNGAGGLRAGLEAGVDAALAEAQGPPKGGGVGGTATINVIITREGRLVAARLVRSSGSRMLDVASLAAARNARYPAAPEGLPGARFTFTVSLDYEP